MQRKCRIVGGKKTTHRHEAARQVDGRDNGDDAHNGAVVDRVLGEVLEPPRHLARVLGPRAHLERQPAHLPLVVQRQRVAGQVDGVDDALAQRRRVCSEGARRIR